MKNLKFETIYATLVAACFTAVPGSAHAQKPVLPPPIPLARANPEDVNSIDAIVHALYDVISGPAGDRNWMRFRSLFYGNAPIGTAYETPDGKEGVFMFDVNGYVRQDDPYFKKNSFFESEMARKTQQFDRIAHVFTSYQSKKDPSEAKPFQRGINALQLFNDGTRWYITSLIDEDESAKNPLPAEFLPH